MSRSMGLKMGKGTLVALFIVAVPLFLVTNSVSWAVNDLRLYRHGFEKYDVSGVTGIDKDGLMSAARQIRGYFNSTREPLEVNATVWGEERELFSQRERLHMRDVKRLIWGVYGVDVAAAFYIMVFVVVGLFFRRRLFAPTLARIIVGGSLLTIVLVALVGLIAAVGFDSLFLLFHRVSFANDFWLLDPQSDLVMMFPQGFWFDATVLVALASVAQAVVLGALAGAYLTIRRWQGRRTRQPLFQHSSNPADL